MPNPGRLPTNADQIRKEAEALTKVAGRLRVAFPDRADAEIQTALDSAHARFRYATIRDFVPVLVERAARDTLQHGPTPDNGAST